VSSDELVCGLRSIAPDVTLVAMTGYVDPKVHAEVRRLGVRQILQKPFDIEELFACLSGVGEPMAEGAA